MNAQRLYRLAILTLLLLAFGLRVHNLDAQSLWYDEGVTAYVAQFGVADLVRWTADDIQPPLYYLAVASWGRLAGWSEWSLRFLSVFFGTLTIPLLAVVARRLTHSRTAGALAALFAALHPALLYYSQEARMYAMLVALGIGAAYCVLRMNGEWRMANGEAGGGRREAWMWAAAYVLTATAAVYTHYFAFFLLLALGMFFLLQTLIRFRYDRKQPRSTQPTGNPESPIPNPRSFSIFNFQFSIFILASLTVLLAYLPWFRVLFTRLDVDTSYWPGALKLGEAIRHIAILFTGGETVLEADGIRLLWMYAAVTLVALWGGWQGSNAQWTMHNAQWGEAAIPRNTQHATRHSQFSIFNFQFLILLIPIAATLALAAFTPKFNPRYVLVALPGLLLLWSGGLAALLRQIEPLWQQVRGKACSTEPKALPALAGLVAVGLLIGGFAFADLNWFTDPAFTKAQWRELAAHVRANRDPDEAVVLVSGHAWPIWDYYAPDMAAIRLPDIEILDVNAVLTFADTGAPLATGLADASGAWLVTWQDQVVDPTGVVPLQLGRAGVEEAVDAGFWQLGLRHFTGLDAARVTDQPPMQVTDAINFGDRLRLLGHSVLDNGDLLLFWQPIGPTPLPDLQWVGQTRTVEGLPYAIISDRRPAGYDFPAFRWRPGEVVVGRTPAAEWAGPAAMPGNYTLHLGVYDPQGDVAGLDVLDDGGVPLGKRAILNLTLSHPTPAQIIPQSWTQIAPGVDLAASLDTATAEPGQRLLLALYWRTTDSVALPAQVTAAWPGGKSIDLIPDLSGQSWPTGTVLRTVHSLTVPPQLSPGPVNLALAGLDLPVDITASSRSFVVPTLAQGIKAVFGGQIELLGLTSDLPDILGGVDTIPVSLVWRSVETPGADYTVSLQWLGEDGRPAAQADAPLPGPSSTWLPGQVVTQSVIVPVPSQPGDFRLVAILYNAADPTFPRLRLADGGEWVQLN